MTATVLGFYIVLSYVALIVFRGIANSFRNFVKEADPHLYGFMRVRDPERDHPASAWITSRLDAKREKSRKPRA